MKIKGKFEDTTLGDMKCGEAFVYEGKPYMKIKEIDGDAENAVNLETGHLRAIASERQVNPKAKAEIRLD